jgi:hypothetical protein
VLIKASPEFRCAFLPVRKKRYPEVKGRNFTPFARKGRCPNTPRPKGALELQLKSGCASHLRCQVKYLASAYQASGMYTKRASASNRELLHRCLLALSELPFGRQPPNAKQVACIRRGPAQATENDKTAACLRFLNYLACLRPAASECQASGMYAKRASAGNRE